MKILLIEDHEMIRDSLKSSMEKYECIDEVVNLTDLRDLNFKEFIRKFDIILMDINIKKITGNKDGLELSKELIKKNEDIKIVILTGFDLVGYEIEAKKIGTYGFIGKDESTESLVNKLYDIYTKDIKFFSCDEKVTVKLSKKELEIVQHYASGMVRKEVARKCGISISTLAYTLNSIYTKLDVRNYQEMVNKALELGYIKPSFFK